MEKLIITAALTGAEVTREHNPNLPLTAAEIGEAAYECYRAGAAMVHLHVRKEDGSPTQDAAYFKAAIEQIRSRCDIIVQTSTGGAVGMSTEERLQPVYLKPEMATLTTGTVNFGDDVFYNPPEYLEKFALAMQEQGVKPEIEVFEVGMINNALYLARKGLIEEPMHYDFVMGVPGGIPATLKNLLHLAESLPPGSTWTVAGVGRHELPMATAAILLGGHVRVGFEDNIYYEKGVLAESNAQLVERVARIARLHYREIATPDEARQILRLRRK
ncbi:MAG TPA: 3-keto-5-aminohexanoate cleavage protein [Bacillota bacterium]|jgi:3-keto-5-aminohexanoate cleavage enzyme|nr:3-keto-5-aminohexanoate cleavage protein [Bacillota bacterium]HPZ10791.1 3-keto-5-aminohexanoate cleavage protein [Bacillota bacterium]HQE08958.1 3-keto-5-aminohexanoate cleavage protein [Bacillota bacterium]